ncbi:hypothetical protein RchiOBHm_Chr3g0459451 [Rosa chinensis]|uniref:Uncharacterized protein n=1 Tax=Rosa chinensis TaxID=74649 RepID=A0A2P6R846_ROSCH|nr:hypothetical protein RchiOBHm_Chr3g0459451 [Rosa chinensis]
MVALTMLCLNQQSCFCLDWLESLMLQQSKFKRFTTSSITRRNLADCAVAAEELWWRDTLDSPAGAKELWWKTLDSAALKQSSVSFFNVEKSETAVSRWARAS